MTGWNKKIRITLSTVASSVDIKTTSTFNCNLHVLCMILHDSMFATGEHESLFKVRKRRIPLENLNRPLLNCSSTCHRILN